MHALRKWDVFRGWRVEMCTTSVHINCLGNSNTDGVSLYDNNSARLCFTYLDYRLRHKHILSRQSCA